MSRPKQMRARAGKTATAALNAVQNRVASAAPPTGDETVKTVPELAAKYDLPAPDEIAGNDSSGSFLDYGPPVVVADSSGPSRREVDEDDIWSRALQH